METIDIPVFYKGKDTNIPAQVLMLGYVYKIRVVINDVPVEYERDEEGSFRAVVDPLNGNSEQVDIGLVQAIGAVLEQLPDA